MLRIGLALLVSIGAFSACLPMEKQERFRGIMVVGPHGPEFNPAIDFIDGLGEIHPWRMVGAEPEFSRKIEAAERRADQLDLPSFSWIKVEFLGREVPVSPDHYGVARQIRVEEWIALEACETEPRECLA